MTTSAELLDLSGIGVRDDTFSYELLDGSRNVIGTLDVDSATSVVVRMDTSRSVFRTCTGVSIPQATRQAVDIFRDRLRVSVVLQNGDRWPLGVFMFGDDTHAPRSWGDLWTPTLFDETFIVDQGLPYTVSRPPGASMLGLLHELIDPLHLPDVNIDSVPDTTNADVVIYQAGSSRNKAAVAVAGLLGCFPPFFDNAGTYTLKTPAPVGANPDHVYDLGGHVVEGTPKTTSSIYRAPNQWIVTSGNPSGSLVGIYNLPDSAPNSFANTGRTVQAQPVTMQGLSTQQLVDIAAYITALRDRNVYTQAQFASTLDPRHDTFDLVSLYGQSYQETAWEATLAPGANHTHDLTGIFV